MSRARPTVVVALGGNALLRPGEPASTRAQARNARRAARVIGAIADRAQVVVTHGNGPQVGNILARSERAASVAYRVPMDVAVAESEGEVGYVLQQALDNLGGPRSVSLVTQVLVSPRDPAWRRPTKPVGALLDARGARELRRRHLSVARVEGGWRRVVPSPRPRAIIESDAVVRLSRAGFLVIAAGGGGIPVVRRRGRLRGVEGVVDKDLASAALALDIGASQMYMLTDVDAVYAGFGTSDARRLARLDAGTARRMLAAGEFAPGSMQPKIEAALAFLAGRPRGRVRISNLWDPEGGTLIVSR